jgi:hypothetical protein
MHRGILTATIVSALCLARAASSGPITQDLCPGTVKGPTVWKALGTDVLENLLFADGSLWLSDGTASAVRRFDASGQGGVGLSGIASPGGLAVGPDGLIYAGVGNSLVNGTVGFTPAD